MRIFTAFLLTMVSSWILGASLSSAATFAPYAGGSCTTLTRTLSVGSRGSDVSELQRFIVSRNYPGGGSWMISGYFGKATQAGVKNFQRESGLAETGVADAATRAAIGRSLCGDVSLSAASDYTVPAPASYSFSIQPYQQVQPYGAYASAPNYSVYPAYNVGPAYAPALSAMSHYSGAVGTSVTLYGNGFTKEGNSVTFGRGVIANLRSLDGQTLSFVVPSQLSGYGNELVTLGTYPVSVTNQFGLKSGNLPFAVTSLSAQGLAPTIAGTTGPTALQTNATGTWNLTVSAPSGQMLTTYVTWGDEHITGMPQQVASASYASGLQQTQTFSHSYRSPGTYPVTFRVVNAAGQEVSSSVTVVVSQGSSGQSGPVTLSSVTPIQGAKGTTVVLVGSGFSQSDNTVRFGVGGTRNVASVNGTTIYFTIPHYISPCDLIAGYCGAPITQVQPGVYPLYVTNPNGSSQSVNFTVTQ